MANEVDFAEMFSASAATKKKKKKKKKNTLLIVVAKALWLLWQLKLSSDL